MKKIYRYFPVLALATLFTACSDKSEVATEEHHEEAENTVELTDVQIQTAGVTLGKIEQKHISGTIKVNGVLDVPPQQKVSVSVPFGGFLKNTPLLQGSKVQKGQLIAQIENPEYIQIQQDYLEASNQLVFAKTDYERQQQLAADNVNAQKTLQQAELTFKNWVARKNALQAKLKLLNIDLADLEKGNITSTANVYATINGFVTEVNVNIGKFVNPSDVLFEIVDTEHLHAELIIFEKDVPKIKLGQKVRFTLANETTERIATVYLIGREISTDRTIRIHCHIDNEDKNLLPGMYLKALVEAGGVMVPALPDEAIIDFQGRKYVFVSSGEEQNHFEMTEIKTGPSELGFTEVTPPDGMSPDQKVVTKGSYSLLSKLKNSEEEGHGH